MTKIFAVYFQVSGFPSQSSEYASECCCKQLGRYDTTVTGVPLLILIQLVSLCRWISSSCLCIYPSGVRCTHLLSRVLEASSVLLDFALSRRLSRGRRMRCRMGYIYSLHFSFSWFTTWMWYVVDYLLLNPVCSRGWFLSSVFSSLFISSFVNPLYMFAYLFEIIGLSYFAEYLSVLP